MPTKEAYIIGRMKAPGRSPKDHGTGRICQDCGGKISRWNKGEYCYNHKPTKFPRVRGKPLDEV